MRYTRLTLITLLFLGLHAPVPVAGQLFVEEITVFAVDTIPKQTSVLERDKNYDIICTGTFSFWRDAQGDSVGLVDAAFYHEIPPGEFGFPGLSTSGTNGFLLNGQPISGRIVPPGPSSTHTYRVPFLGLGIPATLYIEDRPPFSIDRHADNTGALRVRIYNVSPEIDIDSSLIDFGEVELGEFRDTVVVFENIGYGPLRLHSPLLGGMDPGEFSYIGNDEFVLQPGERDSFTIRFAPTSVFAKNAFLELNSNDSDSRVIRIPLTGIGVTTLEAGVSNTLRAQAQERNLLPITLFSNREGSNTTAFTFELTYDRGLLLPVDVVTTGTLSAGFDVTMTIPAPGRLRITATGGEALRGTGTLLFIRAWAVWEQPAMSALDMHDLEFNSGNPRARMVDGSVAIDSICNQYLKNISFISPPVLHRNHPNPFNPSTRIAFSLAVETDLRLDVYDASGLHVTTLAEGSWPAGEHMVEFHAAALPSGLYFYRLRSDTHLLVRRMLLLR